MFAVVVTIAVKPGRLPAFVTAMAENAAASRDEPGCHQFDICTDGGRPDEVFLYELYDDEAAFRAHQATPHLARLKAATEGMVVDTDLRTYATVAR